MYFKSANFTATAPSSFKNSITGSYFRTLSNIPHCSIPQEGGLLLFPLWLCVLSDQLYVVGLVFY